MSAPVLHGVAPALRPAVKSRTWLATGVLATASLVALGIGAAAFVAPIPFSESYGIDIAGDRSALNETRATSAALLGIGLLIGVGALRPRWTAASAVVGATVFLAYGLARLVSAVVDGAPSAGLMAAAAVELVVGAACVGVWLRVRRAGRV